MFEIERYSLSTEILLEIQRYNLRYSDADETRDIWGPFQYIERLSTPYLGAFAF